MAQRLTLASAEQHVGRLVVYRAPHVPDHEPGEEGVITSVGTTYVFVRFGKATNGVACDPETLTLAVGGSS